MSRKIQLNQLYLKWMGLAPVFVNQDQCPTQVVDPQPKMLIF